MNDLRLPVQASTVCHQTALTRTLESATAYLHAARLSPSTALGNHCRELAAERQGQAERLARIIERGGGIPNFGPTHESGFQQLWMSLVNRRFPTFHDGLPRECERCDLRLERVLVRLWKSTDDRVVRDALGAMLGELRGSLAQLREMRDPGCAVPAF